MKGRILVADDDPLLLQLYVEMLGEAGHTVEAAPDGAAAAALVARNEYDLVLSDIDMPGLNGLGLLRAVRERDLDLPVVLITGNPALDTALRAVEYGALRYLVKPVREQDLLDLVQHALRLHQMARLKRQALSLHGDLARQVGDRAGLEARFGGALDRLWMAFQPIVSVSAETVYAWEALLRSDEPALAGPAAVLDAAERLGRLPDVGRRVRGQVAAALDAAPPETRAFINLHPRDLLDEDLYEPRSPLSRHAGRVVLEITERAALDHVGDVVGRGRQLRALGFRLAVDDLGAGYAGLSSFALLQPELVKLDMSLVRNIDAEPTKRRLVASMVQLCRDMNVLLVAEGVETAEERRALEELGCDLLQGYLLGRPVRGLPPSR